jgi:hypothetical protein
MSEFHENSSRTAANAVAILAQGGLMVGFRGQTVLACCIAVVLGFHGGTADTPPSTAKIWVGRHQEIEEHLRTAECVSLETLGPKEKLGPNRTVRCTVRPGGPFARMAWRSVPPGDYRGFRESYKAEIAAYAMDKLLGMDMVPPCVERQLQGSTGAAQLWVEDVSGVKAGDVAGGSPRDDWETQLAQMTMFDDLIGNRDRNLGNMLRDARWSLILLDHSRAFGTSTELPRKLSRIDPGYWARIEGLTRDRLDTALRSWLGEAEIQAILDRREKMRAEIRSLSK